MKVTVRLSTGLTAVVPARMLKFYGSKVGYTLGYTLFMVEEVIGYESSN